jgi:hypothetical protein
LAAACGDTEVMRKPKANKRAGPTLSDAATRSPAAQVPDTPRPIDWKKVDAITRKLAALPILDSRTDDEILGYDRFGLPS